jgi:hypothetical protein
MLEVKENHFLCSCGQSVIQLTIYDETEGDEQNGPIKVVKEANEG